MKSITANSSHTYRRRRFEYWFLVGCVGLIGADRIDLFAGHAPFTMTPFLFLAPLAIGATILPKWLHGCAQVPNPPAVQRQAPFLALTALLLFLTFLSIVFGLDPERGVIAFVDLVLVSILGYCISVRILTDPDQERLIVHSVGLALIVYLLFCVGEWIAWTHGIILNQAPEPGTWMEKTFAVLTVGPWIPRLNGVTVDANRAGFILTLYLALIDWFVPKSRFKPVFVWTIGILVLMTLSRSAILCWLAYYLFSANAWKRLVSWKTALWIVVFIVLGLVAYGTYRKQIDGLADTMNLSAAMSERVSTDEGSVGESHILLIRRGLDTWLTSPKTILIGIGYSSGPKALGGLLDTTSKYANFHCLYASFLAEQGLPAFVTIMLLLIYPLIDRKVSAPATLAILVFNISYQSFAEPIFWLTVALLWSLAPRNKSWLKISDGELVLR
jgi:hypothetical protein